MAVMLLTIWRHGQAGEAPVDRQRELTARGRTDLQRGRERFVAQCDKRQLPLPAAIHHSPWVRTTQTAQLIRDALPETPLIPFEVLRPGSTVAAIEEAVLALATGDPAPRHVLLVGHQPLVSGLVDACLGSDGAVPALVPGAFTTLEFTAAAPGAARVLFWAMPPEFEAQR